MRSATENPEADYFDDLIVKDIFEPLATSPTSKVQQRTYDSVAQPFSNYGLFYHHDDVAKIAVFLNNGATINGQEMLGKDMYSSLLSNNKTSGLQVNASGARYDNGFWLRNFNHPEKICSDDVLIPT